MTSTWICLHSGAESGWVKLPPMSNVRYGSRACLLDDGRLVVMGGHGGGRRLASVEVFEWDAGPGPGPDVTSTVARAMAVWQQRGRQQRGGADRGRGRRRGAGDP